MAPPISLPFAVVKGVCVLITATDTQQMAKVMGSPMRPCFPAGLMFSVYCRHMYVWVVFFHNVLDYCDVLVHYV